MCGRESITDCGGSNEHEAALDWSWTSGRLRGDHRDASLRERLREELTTVLEADVAALRVWLKKQESAAEVAVTDPQIRMLVGRHPAAGVAGSGEFVEQLNAYLQPLMRAHSFGSVVVLDSQQNLLVGEAPEPAGPQDRRIWKSPTGLGRASPRFRFPFSFAPARHRAPEPS